MTKINVLIGVLCSDQSGLVFDDSRREVVFEGEKLGELATPGLGRDNRPTDTRGIVETLYRSRDGQLLVHIKDWSHWQGEPTSYSLIKVSETDLEPAGRFEALGYESELGRPLTLDEALAIADTRRQW